MATVDLQSGLGDLLKEWDPTGALGQHSVSITLKPITTPSGTSVGTGTGTEQAPTSVLNPQQKSGLVKNPQFSTHPGDKTDAMYEAQAAKLRQGTLNQYYGILRDLGFMDDAGNFVPGLIETMAARRRADLGYSRAQAERGVTEGAQRGNVLFSGRYAQNLGEAAYPYVRDTARLEGDVANLLSQRLDELNQLFSGFGLDKNMLLAELSQRLAAAIRAQPSGNVAGEAGAIGAGPIYPGATAPDFFAPLGNVPLANLFGSVPGVTNGGAGSQGATVSPSNPNEFRYPGVPGRALADVE